MNMQSMIKNGFVLIVCLTLNSTLFAESLNEASNFTDRIIVKLKDQPVSAQRLQTNSSGITVLSASTVSQYSAATGKNLKYVKALSISNSHVVKLDTFETLSDVQAIANDIMANDSSVAYAEPDVRMFPTATNPNDPDYTSYQWHLKSSASHGMNLPDAWDITTGSSSIVVAVIDTGILKNHSDFEAGRLLTGYDMISEDSPGVYTTAADGDGRDADPADPGDWSDGVGCSADNSSWHGTHVAGTIGAATNNGVDVAGVDWAAKILPIRTLGKCGGYSSDTADAISWAAGLAVSGVPANSNPADVINMSLGGAGVCSTTTQTAINNAVVAGATIVVAAGNSGADVAGHQPANCNNVITVGAHGNTSTITSYSNYGDEVDIMAPGGETAGASYCTLVLSNHDGGTQGPLNDNALGCMAGTSMATPHVAGLVSLMLSVDSALTPAEIETLIKANARNFVASGTCDLNPTYCGAGIADAAATITAVVNGLTPQAPSSVSLNTSVSSQITISWTDNASTETGFKVARSIDGVDFSNIIYTGVAADETSFVDSTTSDGTEYFYSVKSYNGNGDSAPAYSPNTTPTLPAPSGLSATVISSTQINLSWSDNASSEDNLKIERSTDGTNYSQLITLSANTTTYSNTGLTAGTTYHYRVYADNATLTSAYSNVANATTTSVASISAPTNLTAKANSSSQITVTWSDNANNETGYVAEYSFNGINFFEFAPPILDQNATVLTVIQLDPSTTYYFRVYATDGISNSAYSNVGSATTSAKKSGGSIDWLIFAILLGFIVVRRDTRLFKYAFNRR